MSRILYYSTIESIWCLFSRTSSTEQATDLGWRSLSALLPYLATDVLWRNCGVLRDDCNW